MAVAPRPELRTVVGPFLPVRILIYPTFRVGRSCAECSPPDPQSSLTSPWSGEAIFGACPGSPCRLGSPPCLRPPTQRSSIIDGSERCPTYARSRIGYNRADRGMSGCGATISPLRMNLADDRAERRVWRDGGRQRQFALSTVAQRWVRNGTCRTGSVSAGRPELLPAQELDHREHPTVLALALLKVELREDAAHVALDCLQAHD